MPGWPAVPRDRLSSLGDIARFSARVMGIVYTGRVLRFFGESLRQAGILILGSTVVIWDLMFVLGLQCGIEGAYLLRAQGAPAYAGIVLVHIIGMMGTLVFWGANPRAPIGG